MFARILSKSFKSLYIETSVMPSSKAEKLVRSLEKRAAAVETKFRLLREEFKNLEANIAECRHFILNEQIKRRASDEVDLASDDDGDKKRSKFSFSTDSNGYVIVYTDGSCENNGKPNAKAGLGVWFGENHPLNISEPVRRRPTNNVGEIEACTRAIQIANNAGVKKISIYTDSEFLIKCMTQWLPGWKRRNWVNSKGDKVINRDELQELDSTLKLMEAVKWNHVRGHKGIAGNEGADVLARRGAQMYSK